LSQPQPALRQAACNILKNENILKIGGRKNSKFLLLFINIHQERRTVGKLGSKASGRSPNPRLKQAGVEHKGHHFIARTFFFVTVTRLLYALTRAGQEMQIAESSKP